MKEPRPYLLAIISVFLITSVVLLAATAYLYYKSPVEFAVVPKNKIGNTTSSGARDSLQKIYSATIKDLNSSVNAFSTDFNDSTQTQHRNPVANGDSSSAFEKLRAEINTILADKSSDADLDKTNTEAILRVQNVLLTAFSSSNFIDKETSLAETTDKMIGSISIKCLSNAEPVSELIVVVLQPDGTVMQNSNWETGIFYTKTGKHIYSKKLRFNNVTGETKKINFSLENEKYLPGKYLIEVYSDGSLIGTGFKILS